VLYGAYVVCCISPPGWWVGELSAQTPRVNNPRQNKNHLAQHPNHTKRLSVRCCMWCVFRVACHLRAAGLPSEDQPTNNPTNATTQPKLHNTHTIHNACRCIVVCGVCCVLRVASELLGCRAKPHEQTTQGHNTTNITQHPNHTKRMSIRCCMWCVCCVLHVASGLLRCRAKPHKQPTQGNITINIAQHPNHTKRLSIRCCM
jgi:hypothetical protein